MDYLIIFASCFVSSIVTMIFMYLTSAHGTLRIDHSNPEKMYIGLRLTIWRPFLEKRESFLMSITAQFFRKNNKPYYGTY